MYGVDRSEVMNLPRAQRAKKGCTVDHRRFALAHKDYSKIRACRVTLHSL
jgi:hypothetical protein